MPLIPTYDGPQLKQAALDGGYQQNVDVSSGKMAIAKGLDDVAKVADKIDLEQSTVQAQNAELKIRTAWYETDAKLRQEYSGEKIGGYQAAVNDWWKEAPQKFGGELSPRAQMIASKSLLSAQESAMNTSHKHATVEVNRVAEVSHVAVKQSVVQSALAALKDGDTLAAVAAVANIKEKNEMWAKRQNMSAEELAMQNVKDLTVLHTNVISQLVEKDPAAARQYWKELDKAKQFDASKVDEVDKMLKLGGVKEDVQNFAEEVRKKGMTEPEAVAAAREKFKGEAQDFAVHEMKLRYNEDQVFKAREAKDVANQAWSILVKKPNMSSVPTALMVKLNEVAPEEQRQMQDWVQAKARQAKADAEGRNDPDEFGRYYTYRRMAMEDPQKFADIDLTKAQPYVSKGQLNHLVDIQGGIARSDAKAMDVDKQVNFVVKNIKSAILASGLDMTPKEGTPAATEFNNFMGSLSMTLTDAQRAAGDKPLPPEKLKAIGMDMLREKYEQGSGVFGMFRSARKGYQILSDPSTAGKNFVDTKYSDIPKAIRDQLEADMPRKQTSVKGVPVDVDKDKIERAYQRGKEEGRF
jgi:hypothetical protein